MARTFVVAAGGTGGHLFPAQALAKELLARGHRVVLMTDKRFLPYAAGFGDVEVRTVMAGKMGGSPVAQMKGLLQIIGGIVQAGRALRGGKPAAVVGFGGYPSFPTMMAAAGLGLPTLLHEQNRLMGKTNRFMAKRVRAIAASFDDTLGVDETTKRKITVTGNPVRPAIAALRDRPYPAMEGNIELLVTGGSQGASVFGRVLPEALAALPDAIKERIRIHQQSRQEDSVSTQARYEALGIAAVVKTFFEDMQQLLAQAHLVICRAGASTIAELTMAGRPAIYVPYPFAAEDHQRLNAEIVVNAEAGWMVDEKDFTSQAVSAQLQHLLASTETLRRTADRAKKLSHVNAAARLADLAESLATKESA